MTPIVLPSAVESLGFGSSTEIVKGTGASAPQGVDAILSYNSLVMNNRRWLDSIIITGIDGFSDPDIRDEREPNPNEAGETAFNSLYGGRTIVLKGFIRAFTLDKLRDLEQALKVAFLVLEEKPLTIQGKTLASTVQIWCKKNAQMTWSEEQTRDDMFVRSFMINLRASNPRFVSLEEELHQEFFGVIDQFDADTIAAKDYKFIEGEATVKVSGGKLTVTSTATKKFTRQEPEVFQPNTAIQYDYTPKGAFTSSSTGIYVKYIDANNYVQILVSAAAAGVVVLKTVVAGVSTERAMTYTKGSNTLPARVLTTTYRLKAEMRGTEVWFYHGSSTEWTTIGHYTMSFTEVGALGSTIYAKSYVVIRPGSTEWVYDNLTFGPATLEDEQVMTVVNKGNYESQPLIELVGPIVNPVVHNADTNESIIFKIGTEIKAGEVWSIDVKEGTLTDQEGNNKFATLDPTSDWPELIGGSNHLRLSGTGMIPVLAGTAVLLPALSIRYKNSWF